MELTGEKKVWAALLAIVAALLVLAAPAAAEVRTGSATAPADGAIPGEADIVGASASYDSAAGAVTVSVTTREAPGANPELLVAGLLGTGAACLSPQMLILGEYTSPKAVWDLSERESEGGAFQPGAVRSVSGATTTLNVTSSSLAGKPFDCAGVAVLVEEEGEEGEEELFELDEVFFPINGPTPPPSNPNPPTNPSPPASPAPVMPAPKPAALAIAKTKTVKAKADQWTKVKVIVTNPGGSATGAVSLKVKAPKGVELKPGSGKLSLGALQPGKSETASFKVKLTETAKPKSTLSLTATAGGLSAKGSVVVKAIG